MYERMLDKSSQPNVEQVKEYIGKPSYDLLIKLENYLKDHYVLSKEMKFPFGKGYGWGFKYSHKSKHLCYLFFEKDAITVTIQIGDNEAPKLEEELKTCLPKTQEQWKNRYPCGEFGGWIHYRIFSEQELSDIQKLIAIKKKPTQADGKE